MKIVGNGFALFTPDNEMLVDEIALDQASLIRKQIADVGREWWAQMQLDGYTIRPVIIKEEKI
jgi:hypothetical protein